MPDSAQRCPRLIAALEDLAAQEEASLKARDFSAIEAIQERLGALVENLILHASSADAGLRRRIAAVQIRRERSSEWLAAELARTSEELRETEVSQRRVAKIAPVYGTVPASSRARSHAHGSLSFVG
jgi:hypothetical protein